MRLAHRRFPTKGQVIDEYARLRNAATNGTFIAPADSKVTYATYAEIG